MKEGLTEGWPTGWAGVGLVELLEADLVALLVVGLVACLGWILESLLLKCI